MNTLLRDLAVGLYLERPAREARIPDLAKKLETSGPVVVRRFLAARNIAEYRELMRHIVGIERWAQNRLRVALGAPLTMDEYDDYRPGSGHAREELVRFFEAARQDSVMLANELAAAGPKVETKVPHNQIGPVSTRGWLVYIHEHADWESMKFR